MTKIGNFILSNLTMNQVMENITDDGKYYCSVIFNDLGVNDRILRDLVFEVSYLLGNVI